MNARAVVAQAESPRKGNFSLSSLNKLACGRNDRSPSVPNTRRAPNAANLGFVNPLVRSQMPAEPLEFLSMLGERRPLQNVRILPGDGKKVLPTADGVTKVQAIIGEAMSHLLVRVLAREEALREGGDVGKPLMMVIRTEPGVGKTKLAIDQAVDFYRRHPQAFVETEDGQKGYGRVPAVIAAPSYALGGEIEARLTETIGDAPLTVGWFEGKAKAGCLRGEELGLLNGSGLSSHNLCRMKEKDEETGAWGWSLCKHFFVCPVQRQRAMWSSDPLGRGVWIDGKLETALAGRFEGGIASYPDFALTVHAFAGLGVQSYLLKNPRFAVIDEDASGQMLNEATFPLSVLLSPGRDTPAMSKAEIKAKVAPEELSADYAAVAMAAGRGLVAASGDRSCPVEAIVTEYGKTRRERLMKMDPPLWEGRPGYRAKVIEMLREDIKLAKRFAWGAAASGEAYGPSSDIEKIREVCSHARSPNARQEWRFWKIVEERLDLLCDAERTPARPCEERIALDGTTVEISWRSEFAWGDTDTLLLDASASREVVEAVFPEHEVVFIDATLSGVGSTLPQRNIAVMGRTFSSSSLHPQAGASQETVRKAGLQRVALKRGCDAIAMAHPGERILLCTTTKVERGVLSDWVPGGTAAAANFEFGIEDGMAAEDARIAVEHYGNLRGKDGYKDWNVLVAVGKLEPPDANVRRLARCLYYDRPERVDDVRPPAGGGSADDPKAPEIRRLRHRDGRIVEVTVWTYRNRYERVIQLAKREEEIIQAIGRVRAAQRDPMDPSTWPTVYIMGNVFPDSLVYDDFVHVDDLGRGASILSGAIQNGGCLWAEAAVDLGLAACASDDRGRRLKTGADFMCRCGLRTDGPIPLGWAKVSVRSGRGGRPTTVFVWLPAVAGREPAEAALAAMAARGYEVASADVVESRPVRSAPPVRQDARPAFAERVEALADAVLESAALLAEDKDGLLLPELAVEHVLGRRRMPVLEAVAEAEAGDPEDGPPADVW